MELHPIYLSWLPVSVAWTDGRTPGFLSFSLRGQRRKEDEATYWARGEVADGIRDKQTRDGRGNLSLSARGERWIMKQKSAGRERISNIEYRYFLRRRLFSARSRLISLAQLLHSVVLHENRDKHLNHVAFVYRNQILFQYLQSKISD